MGLKSFILVLGIFFIYSIGAVADMSISVDDVFYEGDEIKFAYRFISTQDEIIKYFANVNCPNSPEALLEMKEINLIANEYLQEEYVYGVVDDNVQAGVCTAYIQILEPIQKTISKNFSIITDPSFSFYILLQKKIFLQNENIFLDYSSDVSSPDIQATLIYPDQTTEKITFPITIKAEQIGTYDLEVIASKENYKTITKKTQFGVIESEAEFEEIKYSEENGEIADDEKESSFIKDQEENLDKEDLNSETKTSRYLIYILIWFILLIVSVWIIKEARH